MNLERQLVHELREHTREAVARLETLVALREGTTSGDTAVEASARSGGPVLPSQSDSQATRAAPSLRFMLELLFEVLRLVELFLKGLSTHPQLHLTIKGKEMANYQLTAGDSVVVSLTATDVATGLPAVIDPGSVTAELSNLADTVTVDPSGTLLTITAASVPGSSTGDTVTVNATVGGVAADPFVGTYDVVAVATPAHFALSGTFGTETTPPAAPVTGSAGTVAEAPPTVNADGSPITPAA